mmetsp:Transcript_529/g.1051  ORF Transcript_529/g.1051 Transcript_529/m.1051 type:complete len:407 (+) Transcript_529:47-1267(+)
MNVDPSHYLPQSAGGSGNGKPPLLKLQNIAARPELNGQFGQAVSYSAGRYVVAIIDASTAAAAATAGGGGGNNSAQPTFLKLKPENLTEAGNLDQVKFGASMLVQSAKAYVASPYMQQWGQKFIAMLPPSLQQKVTPNLALLAMAIVVQSIFFLLWFILGKLMGFQKVFALFSFVALLLSVSSPDWMEGYKAKKPLKLIARSSAVNFRMRWKENLVNMTGYTNISERMALAALVSVLLFSGKVLLTPSSPSKPSQMPNMPMGDNLQRVRAPPPPQYDLEHIYKLGYDDANSGKDFGTSIPEDIIKYNAAQEAALPSHDQYDDDANNNFDWVPPSPPPSKSSLGMGTMLSIFTLYRFGKDLVTSPDGTILLEPQYIMTQLRSIESWRLGMLAMSLYRVVTALSSFFR